VDEGYREGESPAAHVDRLAREKAEAVAGGAGSGKDRGAVSGMGSGLASVLFVGGDTVVVHGGKVLGKPLDENDAVRMLLDLSGSEHEVLSGVAIAGSRATVSSVGRTLVRFRSFDEREARAYVASREPLDKAGAYGIQGLGAALVEEIRGDYYTVVGFPVGRFLKLLEGLGWRYTFGSLEPDG